MANYIKRVKLLKDNQDVPDLTDQSRRDRKVTRAEVVKCFLHADFEKDSADYRARGLIKRELMTMNGPELVAKLRESNSQNYRNSPVSQWTMVEERTVKIAQWFFIKDVPLKDCWTEEINKKTKAAEDKVGGNLVLLGKSKHPAAKAEFENCKMPPPDKQTLIGILQRKDSRKGKIQLLDGAHRLVAMSRNRFRKTDMYLGTLTPKGHYDEDSWDPESRRRPKHDF